MVSGFTQVVAVIEYPITQVKSPENFNRFFADQQLDSVMIPVDIAPEAVADFLQALRGWHNMSGVLVTVPHKQRAAALVDELTPRAQHLNAINVIRKLVPMVRLQGDMLDGVGFQLAAEAHGFSAAGKKGLLSGCGGVGSAIAWGLCEAGIRQLALYDQNPATLQLLHNRLYHPFSARSSRRPARYACRPGFAGEWFPGGNGTVSSRCRCRRRCWKPFRYPRMSPTW